MLGIDPQTQTLYVEELYGVEGWLAQHALRFDGQIIASMDEQTGAPPLRIPPGLIAPQPVQQAHILHYYAGARWRGLRDAERISDLVYPLTVAEKMAVTQRYKLDMMPPLLLGVTESRVLAEAPLPGASIICRRLRLAYALTTPRRDADGQPYNYDTLTLHLAHLYTGDAGDLMPTAEPLRLPDGDLSRPMDCLVSDRYLMIADGGSAGRTSAIHIWYIAS